MLPDGTFYDGGAALLRVGVVGALAYVSLVILLRLTGKRTLSKMNAFDLVVTVALGSTLATILLSKDAALAEGVLAFALLILLQFAVTWTSVRSKTFRKLIKAEPCLLFHEGAFLEGAMRRERVSQNEVLAAMRQAGHDVPAAVRSVVLETDGSMSVVAAQTSQTV